ncbi:MAG: ferrous iron transporter B [Candidatus Aureabacteria bacterium]|nr:ferrous iron transporter B [Candidatus Auribacterota bacterium]
MKTVLLIGNPNVGKSVFFSRLTGTRVVASNYPGTTVGFTKGRMAVGGEVCEVVDVPGVYSLCPTSKAEEVACGMLGEGDVVINVVDATNLERNLSLTLELMERGIPLVVALNMWDETAHRGISIDTARLERMLGVPVVPTTALTGEGFNRLVERLSEARAPSIGPLGRDERWGAIGTIIDRVQRLEHRHHTVREILQELTIKPWTGIPIALLAAAASFKAVRLIGETWIAWSADPFFNRIWSPLLARLGVLLGPGVLHDLLIGKLIDGRVDYVQSFGVLSTALYVEFAMVLPYIVSFYFVLGVLEDSGYLPRLAILMDTLLHRIGLHGFAIIPALLSFGCNVPGILATRVLESRRERFIASTLISIGIPCAALQAMIVAVLGKHGLLPVAAVYAILAAAVLALGFILNRLISGFSPELLLEIPPYRLPPLSLLLKKTWWRVGQFIKEALPVVVGGVLAVNLLYMLDVFSVLARLAAPVVRGLLGLPEEAVVAVVVGVLRKDVAMGMLALLPLTVKQLVVASVVLAMTFPCVATFVVLWHELGWRDMLKSTGIMLVAALCTGGLVNHLWR